MHPRAQQDAQELSHMLKQKKCQTLIGIMSETGQFFLAPFLPGNILVRHSGAAMYLLENELQKFSTFTKNGDLSILEELEQPSAQQTQGYNYDIRKNGYLPFATIKSTRNKIDGSYKLTYNTAFNMLLANNHLSQKEPKWIPFQATYQPDQQLAIQVISKEHPLFLEGFDDQPSPEKIRQIGDGLTQLLLQKETEITQEEKAITPVSNLLPKTADTTATDVANKAKEQTREAPSAVTPENDHSEPDASTSPLTIRRAKISTNRKRPKNLVFSPAQTIQTLETQTLLEDSAPVVPIEDSRSTVTPTSESQTAIVATKLPETPDLNVAATSTISESKLETHVLTEASPVSVSETPQTVPEESVHAVLIEDSRSTAAPTSESQTDIVAKLATQTPNLNDSATPTTPESKLETTADPKKEEPKSVSFEEQYNRLKDSLITNSGCCSFFSGNHTSQFINEAKKIRDGAMQELRDEISKIPNQKDTIISLLTNARKKDLFKEHRKNHWYEGAWGRTATVQEIDTLLKQYRK